MNRRYRELEKKAIDTRRTYEKLAKKAEKLESEKSKLITRVNKSRYTHEELKKKSDNECSEEDAKLIHVILTHIKELNSKFSDNFIEETTNEIERLRNESTKKDTMCNEMLAQGKRIVEELNRKENYFKELWNSKSDIITEEYTKNYLKEYNDLDKQRIKNYKDASQLFYERDLAVKKIDKLKNKIRKYNELVVTKEDLIEKFCKLKNIERKEIATYISNVKSVYRQEIDQKYRYEMLNGLLQESIQELNQLKDKLNIAKGKMEEAEYQFTEYKSLINVA